jgi:hypothetical protein
MKILSLAIIICLLSVILFQPSVPAQQPEKVWDPWLIRAETVTSSLVEDAADLSSLDRPLLWARLGIIWLTDDPERAHAWMKRAVDEVEVVSDGESSADRSQRLATVRSLVGLIAPKDKELGARLSKILETRADAATDGDRRSDANGVVDSALALVNSDPERAAKLGSDALRIALGYRLATLLWQLRKRDSKLSDSLFDQLLTVAGATYDQEALSWLAAFAFHGETPGDAGKAKLLGVLAVGLLRLSPAAGTEEKACGLAPTVGPLIDQFDRLLPQQAPLVRGALARCEANLKASQTKSVDETVRGKSLDEAIKAADDAPNEKTRDELLFRAARMAAEQKLFERAIPLLDRVSDDGRKLANGDWETAYWSYSAAAAVGQLKRSNRPEMQRIIAATKSSLRPFVQLAVATALLSKNERVAALELLEDARRGLPQAYAPGRVDAYLGLVRLYAELAPADSISVLSEAAKAINNEEAPKDEYAGMYNRINVLSNDLLLQIFKLPASLFEVDEVGLGDSLSSIKSPTKRVAARLNLLRAALERHRTATPPPATSAAKDNKSVPQ